MLVTLIVSGESARSQSPNAELDKAIATLRNIDPQKITKEQEKAAVESIESAWKTIRVAGAEGTTRLRQEIKREGASDYFKLNGCALLWDIGRLNEAETIASVWASTRLEVQSNYVFYPAFEAAQTHDPRALPMLKLVLNNNKFGIYVAPHAMDVKWPLTLEFIWGAYGSKGLPVLNQVLEASDSSIELESAMVLLTSAQYLDALPRIRALAKSPLAEVRETAIRSLGMFGHPQDYELLISGLKLKNDEEAFHYVYAVYEYEDVRAVPILVPLLKSENEFFRREVISALLHLANQTGFDALDELCRAPRNGQVSSECGGKVAYELKEMDLTWNQYEKMNPDQKVRFFAELREKLENARKLGPTDKRLSHQELTEAITEWTVNGRAFTEKQMQFEQAPGSNPNKFVARMFKYGWVTYRHVLSVASPDDISALYDARASILRRLSDECLYEVAKIDNIVRQLNRSRYRKSTGISESVNPN